MLRKKLFLIACLMLASSLSLAAQPVLSSPSSIRQGEPLLVWLRATGVVSEGRAEFLSPSGAVVDRATLFDAGQSGGARLYGCLFALDFGAKPGSYAVVVTGKEALPALPGEARPEDSIGGRTFSRRLTIGVEAREFSTENIPLDDANTDIKTVPDPKKVAEAEALYARLGKEDADAVYLDGPFALPTGESRRSAGFGDRRRYIYSSGGTETSVHAGVDIAVPKLTPVHAAAAGRVVFAGPRIVTGVTVILEHLPGLYSIYMHLTDVAVAPGLVLRRGDLIGHSGSTGLSTGPHLHWELRLKGAPVDPDYWVSHSPLPR
jgi:hypothetical protein